MAVATGSKRALACMATIAVCTLWLVCLGWGRRIIAAQTHPHSVAHGSANAQVFSGGHRGLLRDLYVRPVLLMHDLMDSAVTIAGRL